MSFNAKIITIFVSGQPQNQGESEWNRLNHHSLVLPITVWWWVQPDEIAVGEEREYISTLWVFRSLVKL
jgi:hypothetical protein